MGETMMMPNFITSFMVAFKTLARMLGINYQLLQANVPVFLPSSGSIGNNGALTLTTALDNAYVNCYMYFPANAIAAGVAAGRYFVQMSSTTAGTIFNNTYTSGRPTIPSSPTAFVTTGPGAYTQTTATDITLLATTLPGGELGVNGSLFTFFQAVMNSSANTKTLKCNIGGTETNTSSLTTSGQSNTPFTFRNKGVANRNVSNIGAGFTTGSATPTHTALDTTGDLTVLYTARLQTATDYAGFVGLMAQINPGL
jgi:hypothetical protein